jgi:hypothetical protein
MPRTISLGGAYQSGAETSEGEQGGSADGQDDSETPPSQFTAFVEEAGIYANDLHHEVEQQWRKRVIDTGIPSPDNVTLGQL